MPPRALWSGTISFGLVTVPIRLYPAIREHTLHFNLIHQPDGGAIGYQKICKVEGEPVADDEVMKAYELSKGELVPVTDEDFEAVRAEGVRTIDITDFVPEQEIDPLYFARSMYVGAQEGGERVYGLLVQAMEDAGLAAICKFVMREKQHLGCLRVHDGGLVLEQLYFADEIRPLEDVRPERVKADPRELEMARQLIDSYAGSFEPEQYRDTYRDALLELIEAKHEGKEVVRAAEPEEQPAADLIDALRASIEATKSGKKTSARAAKDDGSKRAPAKRRSRARA